MSNSEWELEKFPNSIKGNCRTEDTALTLAKSLYFLSFLPPTVPNAGLLLLILFVGYLFSYFNKSNIVVLFNSDIFLRL